MDQTWLKHGDKLLNKSLYDLHENFVEGRRLNRTTGGVYEAGVDLDKLEYRPGSDDVVTGHARVLDGMEVDEERLRLLARGQRARGRSGDGGAAPLRICLEEDPERDSHPDTNSEADNSLLDVSGLDSERTQSVVEDYVAAEHAESGFRAIETKSKSKNRSSQDVQSQSRRGASLSKKQRKMAGRGRRPGALKGTTWEYDATIKLESKPTDLFPPHPNIRKPAPATEKEKKELATYKRLQKRAHRGPFYTQPPKRDATAPAKTFSDEQFALQYNTNPKAEFDPFTGVETYSQKFQPKPNELPKLSSRTFNKELFPKELWSTLEGKSGENVKKHLDRNQAKKTALLASMKNGDKKSSDKAKIVLEKMNSILPDADLEDEEADEDQEDDDERDSVFDDESMGGDYDAEQYFDNGEDNSEGEAGGGADDYD